jgi:PAS domain S-box-containing protein
MNDGVSLLRLIYDESGRPIDYVFLDINCTYEIIMEVDRVDRIGRRASECYGQANHLEIYERVDATGQPAKFCSYSPNQQKHLSVSAFSPGKGEVAVVFSDITEHRHSDDLNRALSEINLSINASPGNVMIINPVLSVSLDALGADLARLYLRTDGDWDLQFAYSQGEGLKKTGVSREEVELIGLIARGNKPLAIADVSGDGRIDSRALKADETRSLLAASIPVNQKSMGVIIFYFNKPVKKFTWAQVRFADRLSAILSLALANSQLYESLQQKLAEQKRLEKSLREIALNTQMRAAVLEATIAAMGEGVVIYDNKGNIVRMNEYARKIFGYTLEDIEKPIQERVNKIRLSSLEGILQTQEENPVYRAMQGEVLQNIDHLLINGNGEKLWVSISAAPLKDETRALFGAVITLNDITERKKAEEVLKLNEARLKTLVMLNDMADAPEEELFDFALQSALNITESWFGEIFTVCDDDRIEMIRSIVKNKTGGYEPPIGPYHHTRNMRFLTELLMRRRPVVINDHSAFRSAMKHLPDGHMPVSRVLEVPVIETDHIVAVCLVANKETEYTEADAGQLSLLMSDVWRIAARKRAEHELLEAKKQAELYLDLMGHDISNMHQIAIGYLELVGEFPEHAVSDRSILDKPLEALKRSAQLIDNVRKLQKIRAGDINMRAIDLDEILAEAAHIVEGVRATRVARELHFIPGRRLRGRR